MSVVTKPLLLDETGQDILEQLQRISAAQGPQGNDYVLTAQDKADIAALVLAALPSATGVSF